MVCTRTSTMAGTLRTVSPLFAAACLTGLCSCGRSTLPRVGQELSTIKDVSIVRVRLPGNGTDWRSGSENHQSYIKAERVDLLTCLSMASNFNDPIVLLTELPPGDYRISVRREEGEDQALARVVCRALSEAFHCSVTRRMIELDAVVLRCADRQALKLEDGTNEHGFYQHDESPTGIVRTHFSSTLDHVATFAGYIARQTPAHDGAGNGRVLLEKVFVNETGILGIFEGILEWDPRDASVLESSLKKLGFELKTAKRTVPAIVVEPQRPNVEWTYLSDRDGHKQSPPYVSARAGDALGPAPRQ